MSLNSSKECICIGYSDMKQDIMSIDVDQNWLDQKRYFGGLELKPLCFLLYM